MGLEPESPLCPLGLHDSSSLGADRKAGGPRLEERFIGNGQVEKELEHFSLRDSPAQVLSQPSGHPSEVRVVVVLELHS